MKHAQLLQKIKQPNSRQVSPYTEEVGVASLDFATLWKGCEAWYGRLCAFLENHPDHLVYVNCSGLNNPPKVEIRNPSGRWPVRDLDRAIQRFYRPFMEADWLNFQTTGVMPKAVTRPKNTRLENRQKKMCEQLEPFSLTPEEGALLGFLMPFRWKTVEVGDQFHTGISMARPHVPYPKSGVVQSLLDRGYSPLPMSHQRKINRAFLASSKTVHRTEWPSTLDVFLQSLFEEDQLQGSASFFLHLLTEGTPSLVALFARHYQAMPAPYNQLIESDLRRMHRFVQRAWKVIPQGMALRDLDFGAWTQWASKQPATALNLVHFYVLTRQTQFEVPPMDMQAFEVAIRTALEHHSLKTQHNALLNASKNICAAL